MIRSSGGCLGGWEANNAIVFFNLVDDVDNVDGKMWELFEMMWESWKLPHVGKFGDISADSVCFMKDLRWNYSHIRFFRLRRLKDTCFCKFESNLGANCGNFQILSRKCGNFRSPKTVSTCGKIFMEIKKKLCPDRKPTVREGGFFGIAGTELISRVPNGLPPPRCFEIAKNKAG